MCIYIHIQKHPDRQIKDTTVAATRPMSVFSLQQFNDRVRVCRPRTLSNKGHKLKLY